MGTIEADSYIYINCLWIAGSMKGHGYSNDLLNECINDAVAQGKRRLHPICRRTQEGISFRSEIYGVQRAFPSQMCPIAGLTLCIAHCAER